jgi:hypothetical protein
MVCNNKETIFEDIQDFFQMAKVILGNFRLERKGENELEIIDSQKRVILEGSMQGEQEANVGRYAIFQAKTEEGCELVVKARSLASWGYMAFLFHDQVIREIGKDMKFVVTTGLGPDLNNSEGLSTRFELILNEKNQGEVVVARCLLSYRDGSNDPSMGPTIEMMAVRQDFRGRGLLPLLWFWVRTFIEDNFTLECLNNAAPLGHVMIKATQLTNAQVEIKDGKSITDKTFFYNHAGFSVRKQLGMMATMMGSRRPIDEEAVLYVPLLTIEQLKERSEKRGWTDHRGARNCGLCQKIDLGLLRCSRCGDVYYCNRNCQKKDWKHHKEWCGKTPDEVHEELVKEGRRVQNEDGSWSTMMG